MSQVSDPEIAVVLDQLIRREPIFHRSEFGVTRVDFENMTESTFWEVGASGRCYSREHVLDELEKRTASKIEQAWETDDFDCLKIADDSYLLTYKLIQDGTRV